jgi:hypothetical protein
MLLLSIVALTYDFSKSPIITYLIGLYLIEVALGNVKNNKWIIRIIGLSGCIILFFYVIVSKIGGSLFSIYSGPIGRILFTQIATLFLHFEAFPLKYGFLNGASFNHWMSFLFPAAEGLRSGRVVMSIYNASGVAAKRRVMNTNLLGKHMQFRLDRCNFGSDCVWSCDRICCFFYSKVKKNASSDIVLRTVDINLFNNS